MKIGNHGFTVTEALVGAALLLGAMAYIGSTVQQSNRSMKTADTQLLHMDMKTQVISVLSDPATCPVRLRAIGNIPLVVAGGDLLAAAADPRLYIVNSVILPPPVGNRLVQDGEVRDFLQYGVVIDRAQSIFLDSNPPVVPQTNRYLGIVRLTGNRVIPGGVGTLTEDRQAMGAALNAFIPVMMTFDRTTGNLVSCSSAPEGITNDDYLYAPVGVAPKLVAACNAIGGFPYPTELGLICRVPNPNPPADNPAPWCPAGWNPVMDPDNPALVWSSTAAGLRFEDNGCRGTQVCNPIPGHDFGPGALPGATCGIAICRSTCGGFSIGGALIGAAAGVALGTFLGPIMGFACLRKRCRCATAIYKYTYTLTATGCY